MAEPTTTARRTPDDEDDALRGRGRTTIADRVIEGLAARIALDVPGVVRHSSGGPGPLGSTLPTASVEQAGDRVRIALRVAVDWAAATHDVAAGVRDGVRDRLAEVTGKVVDRVDVTVAALVPEGRRTDGARGRRVR